MCNCGGSHIPQRQNILQRRRRLVKRLMAQRKVQIRKIRERRMKRFKAQQRRLNQKN